MKSVLVTGGTSGIGEAVVRYLLHCKEYEVISFSLDKTQIKGVDCYFGDITSEADCAMLCDIVKKKYKKLDGLVNCAGITKLGGIEEQTFSDWNKIMDVNLTGAFLLTKTLLPLLKKGKNASVVNISSFHSEKAGSSIGYCVSKAGLDMFTKYMALELAKYNIRVNSVNPGACLTNIYLSSGDYTKSELEELFKKREGQYPLGRTGHAEKDIAPTVEFLLSDKSLWTTGTKVFIDGGKSLM